MVYLDACGPLPSLSQHTLRLLASRFCRFRPAPIGVLTINFAKPSIGDPRQACTYL